MKEFDIYEPKDPEEQEKFRYALGKNCKSCEEMVICIGLNPSTATDKIPDRTFNKIRKIVEHNEYDDFVILNICPQRSSNPKNVKYNEDDATKNCKIIQKYLDKYPKAPIWCAWGNNIYLEELEKYRAKVEEMISTRECFCTSVNKTGEPKHPLFEKENAEFNPFTFSS